LALRSSHSSPAAQPPTQAQACRPQAPAATSAKETSPTSTEARRTDTTITITTATTATITTTTVTFHSPKAAITTATFT
jgi:hypothetical protein